MTNWPVGLTILFKILEDSSDPSDPMVLCRLVRDNTSESWDVVELDEIDGVLRAFYRNGKSGVWTYLFMDEILNDPGLRLDFDFVPKKLSELNS